MTFDSRYLFAKFLLLTVYLANRDLTFQHRLTHQKSPITFNTDSASHQMAFLVHNRLRVIALFGLALIAELITTKLARRRLPFFQRLIAEKAISRIAVARNHRSSKIKNPIMLLYRQSFLPNVEMSKLL